MTNFGCYPIVELEGKKYIITKWKLVTDFTIKILEKREATSGATRMTEFEKLRGMVTSSIDFINT